LGVPQTNNFNLRIKKMKLISSYFFTVKKQNSTFELLFAFLENTYPNNKMFYVLFMTSDWGLSNIIALIE
jgi:hypothetical protein